MDRPGATEGTAEPGPNPGSSPDRSLAAELRGIEKSFFGRPAVGGVDLDVRGGEVHGILGENGAGKSTLCSVLAGLYRPEAGEILVEGQPHVFHSPRDALDAGVGMVYQHFRLVRTLTVAENLELAVRSSSRTLSRRQLERRARSVMDRLGFFVDPAARVSNLSVGEQQRVEILKLLSRGVSVLILDEPTAVLTPQEAVALFDTVERMAAEGTSVILVSHKLEEVQRVCDRITILRGGRRIAQVDAHTATPSELARMMIGREYEFPTRDRRKASPDVELVLEGLRVIGERGNEAVRGVDLRVHRGEILGLAGVAGNGQRELADAVAGLRAVAAGRILLGDGVVDITNLPVADRIDQGLAYVPEDRLHVGVAAGLPAWMNLGLRNYRRPPYSQLGLLSKRRLRQYADELIGKFDIRGISDHLPTRLLSGGNLQRMVLARETAGRSRVLLAASPTRGLDVAAIAYVRKLILAQRDEGTAVLLISEDLDELLALADRIAVIYEGGIVGEMPVEQATPESVGLLMAGRRSGPADPGLER
jgi:general nucleoside transport system ATP-binding protein